MNNIAVVHKVSEKTGLPPETCEEVIKALEQTLQEELSRQPGTAALYRIAEFARRLTASKYA